MAAEITVHELKKLIDQQSDITVLDVRRPDEYEICHISKCLVPLDQLESRLCELNPEQKIIVHCRSGGRSAKASALLQSRGFKEVYSLKGGIKAWIEEIDPTLTSY